MLEAKTIDQTQSTRNGPMRTELSVTLSYLPSRINSRIYGARMTYFFRTLRNPE